MPESDELSPQYVAGFFDGEGSVGIYFINTGKESGKVDIKFRVNTRITNTNQEVLQRIKAKYGGAIGSSRRNNSNSKWVYNLEFGREDSERLLIEILPYLIIKRERAKIAIEASQNIARHYWRLPDEIREQRKQLVAKMKLLNKKGLA